MQVIILKSNGKIELLSFNKRIIEKRKLDIESFLWELGYDTNELVYSEVTGHIQITPKIIRESDLKTIENDKK